MSGLRLTAVAALAFALIAGAYLAACGGGDSVGVNGSTSTSATAPAMISAGDAPATALSNVLAAMVTISAVTFTNTNGTSVQLLQQPRTVELTHLGGIREPLELDQLPQGTYDSLSITVSQAVITYVNSSDSVVVATATLSDPTATITLNPELTVNSATAIDVRFDFDLASSITVNGSTVTFTPTLGAAVATVASEGPAARVLYINGTVTNVTMTDGSATTGTITVTLTDTQWSVVLNVTSNTVFDDGVTLATLQVDSSIMAEVQLQTDGSLLALLVEPDNGGSGMGSGNSVVGGLILSTTTSNGAVTSFTMAARDGANYAALGHVVTVNIGNGTTFQDTDEASGAGLSSYANSTLDVFPGAGVRAFGAISGNASSGFTIAASSVRPGAVDPYGELDGTVSGTSPDFSLPLLVDSNDPFAHFSGISSPLTVETNANTNFDGSSAGYLNGAISGTALTSSNITSLPLGAPLTTRGFVTDNAGVFTEYATNVHEENH